MAADLQETFKWIPLHKYGRLHRNILPKWSIHIEDLSCS